jgi:protein-L-isoaspartate(D-aspartate) O-methyltransferase
MTEPARKIKLVMDLRRQGLRDARVLSALELTPRDLFVPEAFADQAYDDQALPIACGQTISQPYIVAFMTQALELGDRMKVLEVGTGSGYQAAVLSALCRRVYTVERYRTLLREAEKRFESLELGNVTTRFGDGLKGWPEQAPFDRIIVTAATEEIPTTFIEQLKIGGVMILPLGPAQDSQSLVRIRRTEAGFDQEDLLSVRFVPIVQGVAREL